MPPTVIVDMVCISALVGCSKVVKAEIMYNAAGLNLTLWNLVESVLSGDIHVLGQVDRCRGQVLREVEAIL